MTGLFANLGSPGTRTVVPRPPQEAVWPLILFSHETDIRTFTYRLRKGECRPGCYDSEISGKPPAHMDLCRYVTREGFSIKENDMVFQDGKRQGVTQEGLARMVFGGEDAPFPLPEEVVLTRSVMDPEYWYVYHKP